MKRHHHQHHHHHSFRPVVVSGQPTINNTSHHQQSVVYPSTNVQSSQDSTLTQVTSIMVNDHNYQTRYNNHIDLINRSHEQQQQLQGKFEVYMRE